MRDELMRLAEACEGAEGRPRIKLEGERQRYTIMASNGRYFIMVKPFNAQKTYLYTIADLERGVRGPCNLIFGLPCDVDIPEGASEALGWIEAGNMDVSFRKCVELAPSEIAALRARATQSPDGEGPQPHD